ncbi:MAG: metallophosphoesterase [Candidatus Brocadiales bacterium]
MALKAVAVSDLHLGEPASILCDQTPPRAKKGSLEKENAIDELATAVHDIAVDEGREARVEELILLGDIPDMILDGSKDFKVSKQNTKNLISAILKKGVKLDRVVFVPGNHDYGLWVTMVEKQNNRNTKDKKKSYGDCKKTNYDFKKDGASWVVDFENIKDVNNDFKNEFLPKADFDVLVANPIYSISGDKNFYLFHHGHLTAPLVMRSAVLKKIDEGKIKNTEDLENEVSDWVRLIWGIKRKTSWVRRVWEFGWKRGFTRLDLVKELLLGQGSGAIGAAFARDERGVDDGELQHNIKSFIELACKVPLNGSKPDMFDKDYKFHYVFGHSHYGGRAEDKENILLVKNDAGRKKSINVWNLGGWVVPRHLFPPYAYIFYVKSDWTADRCLLFSSKFEGLKTRYYPSKYLKIHALAEREIG